MASISDINPNFITSAAVAKEQMRQQLQIIKDVLTDMDAALDTNTSGLAGLDGVQDYKRLSNVVLAVPGASIIVQMPTGYNRYMVEFIDMRGVADGTIACRVSQDGVSFFSGGSDYAGSVIDYTAAGLVAGSPASNGLLLTGNQGAAKPGAFGKLFLPYTRNSIKFECCFHRSDDIRGRRDGFCGTAGTSNLAVQFYCNNGATNLAVGSTVVVYGAP